MVLLKYALTIDGWTRWQSRISILFPWLMTCLTNFTFLAISLRLISDRVIINLDSKIVTLWRRTRYCHCKYIVMLIWLTIAPTTFMGLMNRVLIYHLDLFHIVFMDNILIYSRNMLKHASHFRVVLQTIRDCQLLATFCKCDFWFQSVAFLGNIVSSEGMRESAKDKSSETMVQTYLGYKY